jgi:hypothetical protein
MSHVLSISLINTEDQHDVETGCKWENYKQNTDFIPQPVNSVTGSHSQILTQYTTSVSQINPNKY